MVAAHVDSCVCIEGAYSGSTWSFAHFCSFWVVFRQKK